MSMERPMLTQCPSTDQLKVKKMKQRANRPLAFGSPKLVFQSPSFEIVIFERIILTPVAWDGIFTNVIYHRVVYTKIVGFNNRVSGSCHVLLDSFVESCPVCLSVILASVLVTAE